MTYNHDMTHCVHTECSKKKECYRFWLGKEFKNQNFKFAKWLLPKQKIIDGCNYYLNINDYGRKNDDYN